MRVVFRTDASPQIGSGHVMRCLALAAALRDAGADCHFICRAHDGHLGDAIRAAGHGLSLLPVGPGAGPVPGHLAHGTWLGTDMASDARDTIAALEGTPADWLVVDHYGIDAEWERALRSHTGHIAVIDDLADRHHDADLLLDQNFNTGMDRRYAGLVPPDCATLVGPHYALLRDEFAAARAAAPDCARRDGAVRRLLVFFGGADTANATGLALEAIAALGRPDIAVDVVVGALNPHRAALEARAATMPQVCLLGPQKAMAPLMAAADLAIGGGGTTLWERACLGLPSLVLALAPNQEPSSSALADAGLLMYLGRVEDHDASSLAAALATLCRSPGLLRHFSAASAALVDGQGMSRLLAYLVARPITLRRARRDDAEAMYAWRNDPSVRRYAGQTGEFSLAQHLAWFEASLADPRRALLIGEMDGRSIGVLRYDCDADRATISVYLVPGCHGRGLGARLIEAGSHWVRMNWPQIRAIDAHIRTENGASVRAFAAAGFTETWQIRTREWKE